MPSVPPSVRAKATAPLTAPRSRRCTAFWAATLQTGKIGPKPKPATIRWPPRHRGEIGGEDGEEGEAEDGQRQSHEGGRL